MSEPSQSRPKLQTVQVLRAVAATIVVIGHSIIEVPKLTGATNTITPFNYGFGVDIFFVISGFIMTYTTQGDFASSIGRRRFVAARLSRIVPIYWLLTGILIFASVLLPGAFNAPRPTIDVILGSLFFIPVDNGAGFVLPILAVGWTLNYEMMFYLIFVFAMFLPRLYGLATVMVVLVLIAVSGDVANPTSSALSFWANSIIIEFTLGILIAIGRDHLSRLSVPTGMIAIGFGFAIFILMHFAPPNSIPRFIKDGVPAAFIVSGAVTCDLRGHPLTTAPLILLGNASYSLYLSHMFAVRGVRVIWNKLSLPTVSALFCFSALVVAILIALLLARMIELPLHRYMQRKLARPERLLKN